MRVIGNLNKHPKISTTVFQMNDKYIVKFEAGNMEQTFKFHSSDIIGGIERIDEMLTENFISQVIARFNEMYLSLQGIF